MARPIRVEFDGAVYHVTTRGNERRRIFQSDEDRALFLHTFEQMRTRCGVELHAYCLMPNHYHLVIGTPRGSLTRSVGWFQTTYTIRYNRRHRRSGHLFQGRFKAQLVDADAYAQQVVCYVHCNPVRPVDKTQPIPHAKQKALETYRWSSHPAYAGTRRPPDWLTMEWLSYWGRERRAAHRGYRHTIRGMFGRAPHSPWEELRGGLVLGGEALGEQVDGMVHGKTGQEEVRWQQQEREKERRNRLRQLVLTEKDRRIQIWARVTLGGEPLVALGREMGYHNGSGVLQIIRRLERTAQTDRALATQLRVLKKKLSSVES